MTDPKDAKIILYQDGNFNGAVREVTGDMKDLNDIGFNDRISSIKVIGAVWVGYKDKNYQGRQFVLEEGSYDSPGKWSGSHDEISSLRKLSLDIGETPSITLYGDNDYKGKACNFSYAINNLGFYGFNDKLSSLKVKSGAWVLYKDYDYSGRQFIVHEGNYHEPESWHGSHDEVSSLRPVKQPDYPTEVIRMTFDLNNADLSSKPVALVNLSQSNNTSLDQSASWSTKRVLSTTRTYSWEWKNATAVSVEAQFKTGVPVIAEGKVKVGVTNTFSIGEKRGDSNTQSDDWTVTLPAKVKAKTFLRAQVTIQKGKYDVPFTATLRQGNRVWTEIGIFKGTQSYNLQVNYDEKSL